ncbi:hypothetical protein NQ317_006723 [Molorchus minor]|uniref:Protein FRA10AC1 n=1 Tax=Molorchus minor TaxID=1323400 RepID=A0ABQ9K239_9CUCU|nr:hypothetical protein NQ317_006723 [Molorchus minor]
MQDMPRPGDHTGDAVCRTHKFRPCILRNPVQDTWQPYFRYHQPPDYDCSSRYIHLYYPIVTCISISCRIERSESGAAAGVMRQMRDKMTKGGQKSKVRNLAIQHYSGEIPQRIETTIMSLRKIINSSGTTMKPPTHGNYSLQSGIMTNFFKEYCIGDLSLYKENKIALRWRTEKEVVAGKGQFTCGNKRCGKNEELRTWEVNFAYVEHDEKKNALVKIRLCPDCSQKLNYYSKKLEVKRLHKKTHKPKSKNSENDGSSSSKVLESTETGEKAEAVDITELDMVIPSDSPWETNRAIETKSREEEMEEYLQDLLL